MPTIETKCEGSPAKLRSGEWGVRADDRSVQPGDVVKVTTRGGDSWRAVVTSVVARFDDAALTETTRASEEQIAALVEQYAAAGEQARAATAAADAKEAEAKAARRALSAAIAGPAEPVAVPGIPDGTLRGYQQSGVRYMLDTPRSIQADDMGLGKTLQTIATLRASGDTPALVVAPATLTLNWRDELTRWCPELKAQVLKNGKTPLDRGADITIVSYALAKAREAELAQRGFKALVCDEAHYLKNGKAQRTKALTDLAHTIPRVHLLTGTPVTNRPADLVSLLKITGHLDRPFGGWQHFVTRYCDAKHTRFGWDLSGAANLGELAEKLRETCLVRRQKSDVLTELPAKTRVMQRLDVTLTKYREAEKSLLAAIKGQIEARRARAAAARAGKEPAQGASGPGAEVIVELNHALHEAGLAKAPAAIEAIEDYIESDRKVVVFAHHRDVLDAIGEGIKDVPHVRIDGETPTEARSEAVKRFQEDPSCKVFLATTKTAGVGITLTAASDVLIVEQEWVPADLDQAEDRCHRMGQTSAVQAVHLLAAGTVDERILEAVQEKRAVMQAAMADGAAPATEQARGSVLASVLDSYESQVKPRRTRTAELALPAEKAEATEPDKVPEIEAAGVDSGAVDGPEPDEGMEM